MDSVTIAHTIRSQILAFDPMAMMAWGARDLTALNEKKKDDGSYRLGGLAFKMNGAKVPRGLINIELMANDTYTVSVFDRKLQLVKKLEDVYADQLMEVIDGIIER